MRLVLFWLPARVHHASWCDAVHYKTFDNAWQIAWWGLTGIFVNFVFLKPMLRKYGERTLLLVGVGASLCSYHLHTRFMCW